MPWHTKELRSSEKLLLAISAARLSVDLVPLMKEGLQRITNEVGPNEQKAWTEAECAGKHPVKLKTTGRGNDGIGK